MRIESLVTCLEVEHSRTFNLKGVFRKLERVPKQFIVFVELRGLASTVRIRCRVPGMTGDTGTWYESWDELVLSFPDEDAYEVVFPLDDLDPPAGRSVVEALIDGRVAATRVVDFKS